ncbi:MAG: tRNA pseudouridine synthase B [Herpetosiphonaceae bacterium]|nr:MAG: tRNA pseudouridine synthase B [Herpetosiphonaceae bacterium]
MLHGFLNLDKPAGITSHDVVGSIRRLAGQRRVGHGGTLDPLATGVLPVALGVATRLLEYLVEEGRKVYRAEVLLGITTTTDDAEGKVLAERPVPEMAADELKDVLQRFTGRIQQIPPRFSAIQVGGRRMYDLARSTPVEALHAIPSPAAREVEIEHIDLLAWEPPVATIEVACGKGTYIRALARDLGEALSCGGHLQALRRLRVGPLDIRTAIPLDRLRAQPEQLERLLLPLEAAVADWPRADVAQATATDILHGKTVELTADAKATRARVHGPNGKLLALLKRQGERWKPVKVLVTEIER